MLSLDHVILNKVHIKLYPEPDLPIGSTGWSLGPQNLALCLTHELLKFLDYKIMLK
jgi:hypothetical protein